MKRFLLAAIFATTASSLHAQAIDPQCPPGSFNSAGDPDNTKIAQDACQKAIDLFKHMAPQLGAVLAGGNPTQGVSGALGGLGHFSLGIRANALQGSLPEVDKFAPSPRGAELTTYTSDAKPIGFVTADVALGLYRGINASGLGALDALVSASYIPEYTNGTVDVTLPSGSIGLGFGAKVGVLTETATRPGLSVSFLERNLPTVDITGVSGDDRLLLEDVKVKARSWRAVAGKKILLLGVGAGYGRDTYDSHARITVIVAPRQPTPGGTGGPIELTQKLSRNNFFGTVWIQSKVLRIVGEIGRVSGGDIATYNQFSGVQPGDARTYASAGISFGR